jgi:hypothetical protein
MKKGPFEETARTIKYQNSWIRVEEASVIRPNGEKGIFGLVHMKPGSTVLALDARERVLLKGSKRYRLRLRPCYSMIPGVFVIYTETNGGALTRL